MVALATVFFLPELVQWIGSPMLFDSAFAGKMFWAALETREKTGVKRGDYIDALIELKNGKQNKLFGKLTHLSSKFSTVCKLTTQNK